MTDIGGDQCEHLNSKPIQEHDCDHHSGLINVGEMLEVIDMLVDSQNEN